MILKSKGRQKQDGAGTMVLKLKESSQIIKNIKIQVNSHAGKLSLFICHIF